MTQHRQQVVINGCASKWTPVLVGVSQLHKIWPNNTHDQYILIEQSLNKYTKTVFLKLSV